MRVARLVSLLGSVAFLGAVACSVDGNDGGGADRGCAALGDAAYGASPCADMCTPANDAFCADNGVTNACMGGPVDNCGVSTPLPPTNGSLARSANVKEHAGTGAPDVSCFEPAQWPSPPDPSNATLVTLKGTVRIVSRGCESKNLTIEVHRVLRGGVDDGQPGELFGKSVTTPASCQATGVAESNTECGTRYECTYAYPDVPTETELMVITDGDIWAPVFEYGLFIRNADVTNGVYTKDVRALATDDFQRFSQVALGRTIISGNGAFAGEVHDCGDVRLLRSVVDIDQPRAALSYFTDDEDIPVPNTKAASTTSLGLYAALDVAPGPVTVAATGLLGGKLVSLGYFRGRVFPDAMTFFTFRGPRPFQLDAP